jgi:hypothetical protein
MAGWLESAAALFACAGLRRESTGDLRIGGRQHRGHNKVGTTNKCGRDLTEVQLTLMQLDTNGGRVVLLISLENRNGSSNM